MSSRYVHSVCPRCNAITTSGRHACHDGLRADSRFEPQDRLPRSAPTWLMGPRLGMSVLGFTWVVTAVCVNAAGHPADSWALGLLERLYTRPSDGVVLISLVLAAMSGLVLTVTAVVSSGFRDVAPHHAPWVAAGQWVGFMVTLPWMLALVFVALPLVVVGTALGLLLLAVASMSGR